MIIISHMWTSKVPEVKSSNSRMGNTASYPRQRQLAERFQELFLSSEQLRICGLKCDLNAVLKSCNLDRLRTMLPGKGPISCVGGTPQEK